MNCTHTKTDGNQCQAKAIKGSALCFSHNPATKEAKKKAVTKGGRAKEIHIDEPVFANELDFGSAEGIKDALQHVAYAIGNKNLTPARGNALVYACNVSLSILKKTGKHDEQQKGLFDLLKDSYDDDRQRKQEQERLQMKKNLEEIENNKNTSE